MLIGLNFPEPLRVQVIWNGSDSCADGARTLLGWLLLGHLQLWTVRRAICGTSKCYSATKIDASCTFKRRKWRDIN